MKICYIKLGEIFVPKKEQAFIILLLVRRKCRNSSLGLTAIELNNDEGINNLFVKLDYGTYSNVIKFNIKDDMSITGFILEF